MTEDRKRFIGGSDAAAALGLSPWKSPLRLYMEKRGELPPPDEHDRKRQRILDRGKREEPNIVNDVIDLHGIKVTKRSSQQNPNRYVDKEHEWMAAEIDFEWEVTPKVVDHFLEYQDFQIPKELIGTIQNGEVKTSHPFAAPKMFGDEGTDEIPREYGFQAMHGLGVMKRELTLFAVGVYTDDPLIYWVRRDQQVLVAMREKLDAFWHKNVLAGVPPATTNLSDVYMMFGKAKGIRREATEEIVAQVRALASFRVKEALMKQGAEAAKLLIGSYLLGGAEYEAPGAKAGRHMLTFKGEPILQLALEEQERVSVEMLREQFPDAAAACTKQAKFYKFSKPRKGTK